MINLLGQVPNTINIAFSGGVDSLVAAHFFKRGKKKVTLLHFNHGCQYSENIQAQCEAIAKELDCPIVVGEINDPVTPDKMSKEDYWRRARYRFLTSFDGTTITCHHLDDAMETWVFNCLRGNPNVIPYSRQNIIRPFLLTPKANLIEYAKRNNLTPVDDPFNDDLGLTRNYIRANIMDHAKVVNPGLEKVVRKMYLKALIT